MKSTSAERTCATCGHHFPRSLAVCPNCGRDDENPFVPPAMESPTLSPEWRWLAAVASGACGLAGLLALVAPGLSILLLVLASPILARTWAAIERRREAGLPIAAPERFRAVAASTGIGMLATLAAAIAFAMICVPISLPFFTLYPDRLTARQASTNYVGTIVAFASGGVAGLWAGYYVFRRSWPRSRHHNSANTGSNERHAH